jgi:hypothetical protein
MKESCPIIRVLIEESPEVVPPLARLKNEAVMRIKS